MNTENQETTKYQDTSTISEYELQALNFCNTYGVSIKFKKLHAELVGDRSDYPKQLQCKYRQNYRVIVDRPIRDCKPQGFNFTSSITDYEAKKEPTAYDFLACITKSDPVDFKNFCSDYGYSDDSIKAKQIYRAVKNEWIKVEMLFGDCLEALQEIA